MHDTVSRFMNTLMRFTLYGVLILSTSCTPVQPTPIPETFHIQYSHAAQPWLAALNNCAGKSIVAIESRTADFQDPQSANLFMLVGQTDNLTGPAWQIGTDDLLVIVNPQNPITSLTEGQVRSLFNGQIQNWKDINGINAPVQVWVFPVSEDIQQIFENNILAGGTITSLARLANDPEEMSQAISEDPAAIGIMTRRRNTETTLEVYTGASNLPVLAITQTEPQGALAQILACLQK
jgi:hypothetical protein